jgi:hypothetical protein
MRRLPDLVAIMSASVLLHDNPECRSLDRNAAPVDSIFISRESIRLPDNSISPRSHSKPSPGHRIPFVVGLVLACLMRKELATGSQRGRPVSNLIHIITIADGCSGRQRPEDSGPGLVKPLTESRQRSRSPASLL